MAINNIGKKSAAFLVILNSFIYAAYDSALMEHLGDSNVRFYSGTFVSDKLDRSAGDEVVGQDVVWRVQTDFDSDKMLIFAYYNYESGEWESNDIGRYVPSESPTASFMDDSLIYAFRLADNQLKSDFLTVINDTGLEYFLPGTTGRTFSEAVFGDEDTDGVRNLFDMDYIYKTPVIPEGDGIIEDITSDPTGNMIKFVSAVSSFQGAMISVMIAAGLAFFISLKGVRWLQKSL